MSKVNHAKSPLFFPLKSLETRLKSLETLLNKFSNGLEQLGTRLEPRSSKCSIFEDWGSNWAVQVSSDCQLTFEWYCRKVSIDLRYTFWRCIYKKKRQQAKIPFYVKNSSTVHVNDQKLLQQFELHWSTCCFGYFDLKREQKVSWVGRDIVGWFVQSVMQSLEFKWQNWHHIKKNKQDQLTFSLGRQIRWSHVAHVRMTVGPYAQSILPQS